MLSRNKLTRINSWYYLLTVLASMLLLGSCVPTTFNSTGRTSVRPNDAYTEITEIKTKLSISGKQETADILIEKSQTFIKAHPKFGKTDEVYQILGSTLVEFDRTEEAIVVLEEVIKFYPYAPSIGKSLLTLGIAYDRVSKFSKANEVYEKLVNNSKYSDTAYAKTAQRLLQTDKSKRKGALEDLSAGSDSTSASTNFIGQLALDFEVEDLNGDSLSLEKYLGQVVLLDFWATWCGPCIAEMPSVKRTYERYKNKKFQIIGISLDRGISQLETYIEKEGIAWPQYYDSNRQISNMYEVSSIPSTFLIDGDGVIRKMNLRGSALESAVAELVRENMSQ